MKSKKKSDNREIIKSPISEEEFLKLYEKNKIIKSVIDVLPDYVYIKDKNSCFILANEATVKIMGTKTIENLIGKSDKDFYPEELASKFIADEQKLLKSRKPLVNHIEYNINQTTGVECWNSTTKVHICDKKDKIIGIIGISRDITKSVLMERELNEQKEKFRVILESITNGVITTDKNGNVTFINDIAKKMLGINKISKKAHHISKLYKLIDEKNNLPVKNLVADVLKYNEARSRAGNIILMGKKNQEYVIEETYSPLNDAKSNIIGVVIVFRDITLTYQMSKKISYQATHDSLTGLVNRYEFERLLKNTLGKAKTHNTTHVLLFLDLDNFKVVNDENGHLAGDQLLRHIAFQLQLKLRSSDTIARVGGDEFAVLLENCPLNIGERIAIKLCKVIEEFEFKWQDKSFKFSLSVGIAVIDSMSTNINNIMTNADKALYKAKQSGGNCIRIYVTEDNIISEFNIESEWLELINLALNEDKFDLYFQPIVYCQPIIFVNNKKQSILHNEVFIRMYDKNNKLIYPAVFFPVAEKYNLMPAIDRYVIGKIFSDYHALCNNDMNNISINISGYSLNDPNFLGFILDQFEKFNLNPKCISFEIKEFTAINNLMNATEFIKQLRKWGCKFILDDFGTGFQSMEYLKYFNIDYIKIDGLLIKNIQDDQISYVMVESINHAAHILGIKTIAKHVENQVVLKKIKKIGIDYAQGYYIQDPKPLK